MSAAISFTSVDGSVLGSTNSNFNGGFEFTVGANDITVDQLGFYDDNLDGLNASHDVGIYAVSTQSLVASATVPSGTSATLDSMFRWIALNSPVTLNANQTYRVAGNRQNNNDVIGFVRQSNPTINVDPNIVNNGSVFSRASTLTYPSSGAFGGEFGYFGGNFSIASSAAVPFEFSPTLGLVAMGSIFGLSRLRKRIGNSKTINEISA